MTGVESTPGNGARADADGDALALFDLDHTLIPFDSGTAWIRFLVARGALPADAEERHLAYCRQYVAGTLDIHAMHRALLSPLRAHPRARLAQWQREFEAEVAPRVPAAAHALVRRHRDAGHLCALVTTTTRLIAEPFARLFGIALVSSQAATVDGRDDGALTGEILGEPCFREHKATHVARWLAQRPESGPPRTLGGYARSWFYSDSFNDLPLLEAVTDPVAVSPDARLRAHALAAGWPIVELR